MLHGSALLFLRNWLYIHQSICYKLFSWSNSKWRRGYFPYSQQVALPPTLLRWSKESDTGSLNFAPSPQNTAAALLPIFSFYLGKVMTSLLSPSSTAPTVLIEAQTGPLFPEMRSSSWFSLPAENTPILVITILLLPSSSIQLLMLLLSWFSCVWLCATLWPAACQAPLAVGFSRQGYSSGLPCPPPRDLPDPGIETGSPALQADSLPLSHQGSPSPIQPVVKSCLFYFSAIFCISILFFLSVSKLLLRRLRVLSAFSLPITSSSY